MAFTVQNTLADYTNTRFPQADFEGAMDRRKRRELLEAQMAQQKELNDLARLDREREFKARGIERFGADAVVGPDGMVDFQASAANQQKRRDAALLDEAMGLKAAIDPEKIDLTKGGFTPEMLNAVGLDTTAPAPVELQGKSPQFQAAYTKGLAEKARQDFELRKAREGAVARAELALGRDKRRVASDLEQELIKLDPSYSRSEFIGEDGDVDVDAMASRAAELRGQQPKSTAGTGAWKMNQANQFVEETKKSLPPGRTLSPEEESALKSRFMGGGVNSINAPVDVVKAVNTENLNSQRLDDVSERINKFNEKYGSKAFDEFVGPVDAPVFKFRSRTLPPDERTQAEKEARDIHRRIKLVVQDYRKANFGTALTENETKLFRDIVADESFADYTDSINTFNNAMKDSVARRINSYEFAPNIPRDAKERFIWSKKPAAEAPPAQGSGLSPEARRARIAELKQKLGK